MLLRIFLIALILVLFFRFVGRLFLAIFTRPPVQAPPKKKTVRDIDDSQIQDADFKDL
jgi:Na+-transporting methylmalonyl-CoA/oxaloacetate decarboxylase gamma subunit